MDEKAYFDSLLSSVRKPQSGKRLLQVLIALRKQVNTTNHQLQIEQIKSNNCLKPLVCYTQYDANLKVIDLALSILGNCCSNPSVIQQTINELNILHNLNRVLEKHNKDSIQGRVFRILGNLCDGYEPLKIIKKEPSIVDSVVKFLKSFSNEQNDHEAHENQEDRNKISVPTVSMALRFLRKILVQNTFDILTADHGIIKTVGVVLIKCTNTWIKNKQEEVLINDILKIIQVLSSSMYSHHDIIAELRNTENGNALKSFGDIIFLHPERIVKIILKLARLSKYQSDLPIEAIINNLLNAVEINPDKTNTLHREYLECVNKLMDHVGFHDKLKSSDNINLLVKLLRDFNIENDLSVHCCINVCSILNKCKYNEALIKSQLNGNIILVIIDKLQLVTEKSSENIVYEVHEKKNGRTLNFNNFKRFKRNLYDEDKLINSKCDLSKNIDRCASPSSCSDVSSCGPFSPIASTNLMDESDSDNYSPLCSENECDDEFKVSIPEDDIVLSEAEEKRPSLNQDQMELRCKLRDEMNSLLKFYCTLKPLYKHLGNPRLFTILLNIVLDSPINYKKFDCAFSVILSIAQTRDFLIPLMLSGIISQVYEVMDTKHVDCCTNCEILHSKTEDVITKFLSVGESESIKGDIAYLLLGKAKDEIKEKLVLSIPYVIRNSSTLSKLLLDCGGLNILIKLLKDRTNTALQEKSIKSICTLATDNLKIKNPVHKKVPRKYPRASHAPKVTQEKIRVGSYHFSNTCENVVYFKLEDGSCVQADRDTLNEKSDYFSTLLSGRFVESEQDEIHLKNVAKDSLKCLLRLLELDIKMTTTFEFDYDLEIILDVILLSDRFLLNELNYALISHVEQLITTTSVPKFYKWAIESGTNIMRIESVAFALVSDLSYKERLEMFHSLFNLGYFFELVDDIEKLIIQFL